MTIQQVETRLKEHFADSEVIVTDLTGTEDHYEVRILSAAFQGKSRMDQHKMVMAALDAELKSGEVHALTIKTLTKE